MALTARREAFAQEVANGKTQADAYRASFSTKGMKPETVAQEASRLMAFPHVSARVAELRQALQDKQLWTREDSVNTLKAVIDTAEAKAKDKISAVKELNSMHGYNAPTKVDLTVNPIEALLKAVNGSALGVRGNAE